MAEACGTCRYWARKEPTLTVGDCRIVSPSRLVAEETGEDYWCGEYQPRPEPKPIAHVYGKPAYTVEELNDAAESGPSSRRASWRDRIERDDYGVYRLKGDRTSSVSNVISSILNYGRAATMKSYKGLGDEDIDACLECVAEVGGKS